MSIDATIKKYGIKHMFVESGKAAIFLKSEEISLLNHEIQKDWYYWCELSWTDGEEFDFAFNAFGKTFGSAFSSCIKSFQDAVASGQTQPCQVALKYNL
jgi:hypothetical protein